MKRMLPLWPWAAALLSGLLTGVCFPNFSWDWWAWMALTPLIAAVWFGPRWSRREAVRVLLLGWTAGSVSFLINLHWITEVSVAGWIALSLYCGLFTAIFAWFLGGAGRPVDPPGAKRACWLSSRSNLYYATVGAAAWTGIEWLRGVLFSGFGWNSLGVALWQNVPMLQITDLTGVGGLSFLIVMVNLMLVLTVKRLALEIGKGAMRPHYDFALTLALVALAFTYGIRTLFQPVPEKTPLKIACVQAQIPQFQKWNPQFEREILEKYRKFSETAIAMNPDLLLWPEAATPRPALQDETNWSVVRDLAESWDGDFLLGTVHFPVEGDFNSIALLTDRGRQVQLYHKIHLVPFGEFVPFRHSFPLFAWIVGDLVPSDFDAGSDFTILETERNPVRIGPLVCFEDTLADLARHFVLGGAQIFVTVTNDGWFGESAGSVQHLAQSVFRSAENKIPMIRAANTGVTCTIDRNGRVREILTDAEGSTFVEGVLLAEVEIFHEPQGTFFTRRGHLFSHLCLAGTLFACYRWLRLNYQIPAAESLKS